ncbi:MAG: SsrA-binding protein SmpB [Rhodospirillaceae bacterium]|jgi:SsrA-binding protein|nr:SsrA-binding protein SmpB [Rhodospirillaceae bacterium]MBT5239796.1 SsrA-binding protein SmpB [Rhodospirillaceae bacterium]MBT5567188.1 SsrA-binding protein SmpB [Rhodospirillaceae bacterium]MBT6089401.1 SsrA-binding protein SmpB [Rhodospirillaceae bacterium]MBT6962127.1 SsrA-binding protein SmpB [Rhodospirillaceae bacterium]
MTKSGWISTGTVAQNRKARHDYKIEETFEAGLILLGTEVKSLRLGRGNIQESYAAAEDGGLYLINAYIPEYEGARHFGHEPRRKRQLLLRKREIEKLSIETSRKGMTLVPLSIYFNDRGLAKLKIGLAKGKTDIDRRQTIKERDWNRQKSRVLRDRG